MDPTTQRWLTYLQLLALLLWAAVEEARTRKIRNWLSLSLLLAGFLQSLGLFGADRTVGPGSSALGILVGFSLPFVLFAIGALGGGDVKLMAGIGAWLGPVPVLMVFGA